MRASFTSLYFCAVLSVGLGAGSAAGQAQCLELEAELPEDLRGCVSAERLCASYQAALAANNGERALAPIWRVQLRAADEAAEAGVRSLALAAFSRQRSLGQRTLAVRSRDCAALPDALAWVLVLLAEEAGVQPPPPTAAVAQAVDSDAKPTPVANQAPESKRAFALGAGAGVSFGVLPSAAFGLQLQGSLLSEPVALRARAAFLWPQELAVAEGYVRMQSYELALEACPGTQLGARPRIALRVCVGPRLGLLVARGRDFAIQNEHAAEFLLYFGVTPEASLALAGATWLQLSAGAAISLVRPRMGVAFDDGMRWMELSALHWLRAELMLSLVQNF